MPTILNATGLAAVIVAAKPEGRDFAGNPPASLILQLSTGHDSVIQVARYEP